VHIKENMLATIRATAGIQNLSQLSLEMAITLFDLKMVPFITCGLTVIWKHEGGNLQIQGSVKAKFLKKAA
jgi:hypothetical protein